MKMLYNKFKGREIMAKSPFNKKLEKHCEYCVHGTRLQFEDEIICKKHGVTSCDDKCRSYKYDPL